VLPEFGEVGPPFWDTRPTLIFGTGSSLAGVDFNSFRGLGHILAVKEAWRDLPFADACFGLDLPWIRRSAEALAELATRMAVYLAVPDEEPRKHVLIPGAIYLVRTRVCDLMTTKPGVVESGGHSGFGALNLAFLKRARSIYLFGFDCYGGDHYCPERYAHQPRNHNARYLPNWGRNFQTVVPQLRAAGVSVVNASPKSTIAAFPKTTIEQARNDLDRLRSA
jgi:hypothetical protein